MNEELAQYYGTLENLGIDKTASDFQLEKMAEAEVLDEMFKAEGYDIDQVPTDDIVKIAYELFGDDSALVKQAVALEQEAAAEPQEETFQEKVAEADYLGRLMAHAYVNELAEIEKQAGVADTAAKAWGAMKGAPGKAWEATKGVPGALKGKAEAIKGSYSAGKLNAGEGAGRVRTALKGLKQVAKEHPKSVGAGLGTAALLGGGGTYAATR